MIRGESVIDSDLSIAEGGPLEDQMINDKKNRVPTPLMTFQGFYAHSWKVLYLKKTLYKYCKYMKGW